MTTRQLMHLAEDKTVAEFFAGIGLMRAGLESAGWRIAFANDIEEDKFHMYAAHFHDAAEHYCVSDIHTLDAQDIPTVTLATASFPCTDLSLAGKRNGIRSGQSSAFWGFVDILEKMNERRPPLVLLENVPGFLTSHDGADFSAALLALNNLGYFVDAIMLNAERFVPQSRERLFVIGVRMPSRLIHVAKETTSFYESTLRPKALADFIFMHPEINWKLRELPEPPIRTIKLKDILDDLSDDSSYWWSTERTNYLVNQMSAKHLSALQAMKRKRAWSFGTVFRRIRHGKSMAELRTDGIAGCLRTPRGGSGRQILVQAGFGKVKARLLTPRECARLMGVDNFVITTSINKALFGFGDAVCAPVVSWLAHNYLNLLVKEMQEPVPVVKKLSRTIVAACCS